MKYALTSLGKILIINNEIKKNHNEIMIRLIGMEVYYKPHLGGECEFHWSHNHLDCKLKKNGNACNTC